MECTTSENRLGFWRYVCIGILSYTMLVAGITPVEAEGTGNTALDDLVYEAMNNNQDIRSLEEKARALRAEAPFVGSLKDPILGFGLVNVPVDTFELDQEPMTQKQISLSQQVPWFGKLSLAEQAAELIAVEQEAMVRVTRLNVARQLKEAWFELSFVERSLDINRRSRDIISQILHVAETRYANGEGLQQDILMAQVQLSELIDRDVTLNATKTKLQDTIGGLLNRDSYFIENGSRLEFPDLSGLNREALTAEAIEKNPLVKARHAAVLKAEVDLQLAEKDYMPDMNFTVAYGQREDDPVSGRDRSDFLSAGVSITVPLWQNTRQDSKLEGAKKRLTSARRALQAVQKTLPHKVDSLLAEIDGARESKELFADAVSVQAEQLADSSLAAYSVGQVEFGTMLSTHTRLLQVELKIEQYMVQVYKKLAELEEIVGQPIAQTQEKL